mmetsp:Transcript_80188/g.157284  ORF Transcript_80188/g.157284 Transcript_80188/m.157284 type:complete len:216 (+) Transcript_80188:173-820(+)
MASTSGMPPHPPRRDSSPLPRPRELRREPQQPPTRPPAPGPDCRALRTAAWELLLLLFSATCAAVLPEEFFCDTLAPSFNSSSTMRALPSCAATWSGYVVFIMERLPSEMPPLKPRSFRKEATAALRARTSAASRSKRSCSTRLAASARSAARRSSSRRACSSCSCLARSSASRRSSAKRRCSCSSRRLLSASSAARRASASRRRAISCSSSKRR